MKSEDQVRDVARLARLALSVEEEGLFRRQLTEIVGYIDQLAKYEGADVEWLGETPEAVDEQAPCLPREAVLENAPQAREGFVVVPRVKADNEEETS